MRVGRFASVSTRSMVRSITGTAPVLYFPPEAPRISREQQVENNTNVAVDLIRRFKGAPPTQYKRKHTTSFEQIEKEIESLLSTAAKMRRTLSDDAPMDKLTIIERVLRHAAWQYLKDEGRLNFEQIEKWLVYTPTDEQRLQQLKREQQTKETYEAFKKRRADAGGKTGTPLPTFDWADQYKGAIDREIVAEKRLRYDVLAQNTTDRNDAKVDEVLREYRKPIQDKRLDDLTDLLERFKPVLAREAIMQRLTIKHLEGQLGTWKYLDWNPEVRDLAELEADNNCPHWSFETHDRRMKAIRLKSKNEVKESMEKRQAAELAQASSGARQSGSATSGDAAKREKLLREIIQLQSRIGKKDDEKVDDKEKKVEVKKEDDLEKYKVDEKVVAAKGLLGLGFISGERAPTTAAATPSKGAAKASAQH